MTVEKEIQKLILIINKVMECDIQKRTNKRKHVQGRKMFIYVVKNLKLLPSDGMIASFINIHRSTVCIQKKDAHFMISTYSQWANWYQEIMNAFKRDADKFLSDSYYKKENDRLAFHIKKLSEKLSETEKYRDAWIKNKKVHNYIHHVFGDNPADDVQINKIINIVDFTLKSTKIRDYGNGL